MRHPVNHTSVFTRVPGAPSFLTGVDETLMGPLPLPCPGSRTPFQASPESSVPELEMPQECQSLALPLLDFSSTLQSCLQPCLWPHLLLFTDGYPGSGASGITQMMIQSGICGWSLLPAPTYDHYVWVSWESTPLVRAQPELGDCQP